MTLYLTDSQKELTIKAILSEINYHQQKINSWVELYRKLQSEQTDVNPLVMQAEGSDGVSGAAVASSAVGKGVRDGGLKNMPGHTEITG
jgi:hypothetical protein